jgi:hypothetical protein
MVVCDGGRIALFRLNNSSFSSCLSALQGNKSHYVFAIWFANAKVNEASRLRGLHKPELPTSDAA